MKEIFRYYQGRSIDSVVISFVISLVIGIPLYFISGAYVILLIVIFTFVLDLLLVAWIEFQRRLRKTIKYARERGYLLEYTSGILTHGEVIERYGRAVISIKPIGFLGRILNASVTKKFNPTYNVTHPIKVVLDPQKL